MKKSIRFLMAATGLIGATLLTACGGGDDALVAPADKAVAITFAAVNGSTPVACGTPLAGMGSTGVAADLQDLRFYITNLKLVNDKGEAVPVKLDRQRLAADPGHRDSVADRPGERHRRLQHAQQHHRHQRRSSPAPCRRAPTSA